MGAETADFERRKAYLAMRQCRETISRHEAALAIAARHAFNYGASVYEIAEAAELGVPVTRKMLRGAHGDPGLTQAIEAHEIFGLTVTERKVG